MSGVLQAYRKLFFDFHSHKDIPDIAARFDAHQWAADLKVAQVQAVSVFVKCGRGYSFYQKGTHRFVHPHLPQGLDMVEEQIAALHGRGIRTIGYYHTLGSQPLAADHPDWVEQDPARRRREDSICMHTPAIDQWMLPHLQEIVSLYDLDGLFFDGTIERTHCSCRYCRERFQAEVGEEFPASEDHASWNAYVAWKKEDIRLLRHTICEVIHKVNPQVEISFNWAYSPRVPEVVPSKVSFLTADIHPQDQNFNGSYLSRYWTTLGKPFNVMNSAHLKWWGDWGCKPAVAMMHELAAVLALGGQSWIGYQMTQDFQVQPAVMEEMKQVMQFVESREPFIVGTETVPYIAVLHSTDLSFNQETARLFVDEVGSRGVHRLLSEAGFHFHFLNEVDLRQRADKYQVIILPDQRHIDRQMQSTLRDFCHNGGLLIASAFTGTLDREGGVGEDCWLHDVFGISLNRKGQENHFYMDVVDEKLQSGLLHMPHMVEGEFALVQPLHDDVQVLARLRRPYLRADGNYLLRRSPAGPPTPYAAVTMRNFGQGKAVYFAGQVFAGYQRSNQWNIKRFVANLLNEGIREKLVEVESSVPVELVLAEQEKRTIVHLINRNGQRPVDGNNVCLEYVCPVYDVVVRIRRSEYPNRVTIEPQGASAQWQTDQDWLTIEVPKVEIHTMIVIE